MQEPLDSQALADALAQYVIDHPPPDTERVGADLFALDPYDAPAATPAPHSPAPEDEWDAPMALTVHADTQSSYTISPAPNLDPYSERTSTPMDHPWPPQLLVDLALGIDDEDTIALKYEMETEHLKRVMETPAFQGLLLTTKSKLQEEGAIFKARAVAQAEMLLIQAYKMAVDPEVPYGIRAQLIALTVGWADLDPKAKRKDAPASNTQAVQININMGAP